MLLLNVLTFANTVTVPITAERYILQGYSQFKETINAAYTNPNLTISGLLLTRYNGRTTLSAKGMPQIVNKLNKIVFDTQIRESVATKEAQALRKSLYVHTSFSTTAKDYLAFVDELIKRGI